MTRKINKLPRVVLEALRYRGLSDAQIEQLSSKEVFAEYCEWHGLIGWSDTLYYVVSTLSKPES